MLCISAPCHAKALGWVPPCRDCFPGWCDGCANTACCVLLAEALLVFMLERGFRVLSGYVARSAAGIVSQHGAAALPAPHLCVCPPSTFTTTKRLHPCSLGSTHAPFAAVAATPTSTAATYCAAPSSCAAPLRALRRAPMTFATPRAPPNVRYCHRSPVAPFWHAQALVPAPGMRVVPSGVFQGCVRARLLMLPPCICEPCATR